MDTLLVSALFILGTIVGSFLNVVIYRFNTGHSLFGRSHCPSCGKTLSWYELIPLFSYLFQRGRCLSCHAHIAVRYFLVEVTTGVLFAFVFIQSIGTVDLALMLVIVSLLVVITVYDMRHSIIPDHLVLLLLGLALLYTSWNPIAGVWELPSRMEFLGGVGAASFFALLWGASRGRWIGLGDAKLAFPLGLISSLPQMFSVVVLSFWVGAIVGLSLILYGRVRHTQLSYSSAGVEKYRRDYTMKSEIPFAPFLVLAFVLVHFLSADVLELTDAFVNLFLWLFGHTP